MSLRYCHQFSRVSLQRIEAVDFSQSKARSSAVTFTVERNSRTYSADGLCCSATTKALQRSLSAIRSTASYARIQIGGIFSPGCVFHQNICQKMSEACPFLPCSIAIVVIFPFCHCKGLP
jgi:hypothetical protein